eukprot:Filipodium_phascolosomae@DN3498_c0_g1_i1.p1
MMHDSPYTADCLQGKVAVVTGGGTGINKVIALTLMRHGCNCCIIGRSRQVLEGTAAQLEVETKQECMPIVADVRNEQQVESAFQQVLKRFQRLDILVNGAAGNFLCAAKDLSVNGVKSVMHIDAIGTFICSKAAYNLAFLRQTSGGSIVNLSMTLHYCGTLLQAHAGMAKAGIDALTRHLAVEWGPSGVRTNAIAPGMIEDTSGADKLDVSKQPGSAPLRHSFAKLNPTQRNGRKEDIANAVLFLCLKQSNWINGAIMVVDGGMCHTMPNFPLAIDKVVDNWSAGETSLAKLAKL